MTKVTAQMSVSLDGYYAGPRSPGGPHDMAAWLEGEGPGFFRVTRWVTDAMEPGLRTGQGQSNVLAVAAGRDAEQSEVALVAHSCWEKKGAPISAPLRFSMSEVHGRGSRPTPSCGERPRRPR